MEPPQIVIIAGPNGAGKSALAARFVPRDVPFLNADDVARDIRRPGKSADIAAGRLLLERLDAREQERASFALETNLANRTLAARVPRRQGKGYRVTLLFVWLPSADMAVQRVAERVRRGGHDIPEPTIRRRYVGGLHNFFSLYRPLANTWRMCDNTRADDPALIAKGTSRVSDYGLWGRIQEKDNHESPSHSRAGD